MNHQLIIAVGLVEHEDKLLLTRRHHPQNSAWHQRWEFPGGKIEAGETPLDALYREIFEETHLQIHSPRLIGVHTQFWEVPKGTQQTFLLLYHCFAQDKNVQLNPDAHDAYVWMDPSAIPVMDGLLNGTTDILNHFSPIHSN